MNSDDVFHGLRVDSITENDVEAVKRDFQSAGFKAGEGIIDFAGDSPGIVFAVAGRPLGVPWMLGGYPGSADAASFVLEKLSTEQLRKAWILSSEENPRRIEHWQDLLRKRLGGSCFETAATLRMRPTYSWSGPLRSTTEPIELTLWRPLAQCRPYNQISSIE